MRFLIALWLTCLLPTAHAENTTFLPSKTPFLSIKQPEMQAKHWAMCSATYTTVGMLFKDDRPATAELLASYGRGAKVAAIFSYMITSAPEDSEVDASKLMKHSMAFAESLLETSTVSIMAYFEGNADAIDVLTDTMSVCMENLKAQEFYINASRELSRKVLTTPAK